MKYAAVALATAALIGLLWKLNADIAERDLELAKRSAEIIKLKGNLKLQNEIILANKVDYLKGLEKASKANTRIEVKYKERVQAIYQWSDGNATCDNAMQYIDSYSY